MSSTTSPTTTCGSRSEPRSPAAMAPPRRSGCLCCHMCLWCDPSDDLKPLPCDRVGLRCGAITLPIKCLLKMHVARSCARAEYGTLALIRALQVLAQEQDPVMREALRVQMVEFGRTPQQLFAKKHPKRRATGTGAQSAFCCFKPAPPKHSARPTSNVLRPTFQVRQCPTQPPGKHAENLSACLVHLAPDDLSPTASACASVP